MKAIVKNLATILCLILVAAAVVCFGIGVVSDDIKCLALATIMLCCFYIISPIVTEEDMKKAYKSVVKRLAAFATLFAFFIGAFYFVYEGKDILAFICLLAFTFCAVAFTRDIPQNKDNERVKIKGFTNT